MLCLRPLANKINFYNKNITVILNSLPLMVRKFCDHHKYKSKYNAEEEKLIFKTINDMQLEADKMRFDISQIRLKRIISRKKSKGNFTSFSDLLDVDGFGVNVMEKMCDSIISCTNTDGTAKKIEPCTKFKIKGQILDPPLRASQRKKIGSATSIFTSLSTVGWARINTSSRALTHWSLQDLQQEEGKRLSLSGIMELVWSVCYDIPASDIYVMEAMPTMMRSTGADSNNPRVAHTNLQKAQLVAMLATSVNFISNHRHLDSSDGEKSPEHSDDDEDDCTQHKVHYLRSTLPHRLFKTIVGTERISAQSAVENILDDCSDILDSSRTSKYYSPLGVTDEIRDFYFQQTDVNREKLSQTLLLAMTFVELCIYENHFAFQRLQNS